MKEQNALVTVATQTGLAESKIESLLKEFSTSFKEAKAIVNGSERIVVTKEDQTELMKEARDRRLKLKNIRVQVEKTRVALKEQSLREGKAIDGMANIIKALIIPVEKDLEQQEKFAEIKEQERQEARYADRVEKLSKYVDDITIYNLREIDDEAFGSVLAKAKKEYEDAIEAEKQAEIARKKKEEEDRKEQERIRKENEELQKKLKVQQEKEAEERKKQEEKMRKEKEARLAAEKKLKDEKDRIEKEKREREEAEKKEAERIEKERVAKLLAPDKEKLMEFASALESIEQPALKNQKSVDVLNETMSEVEKVVTKLRKSTKNL